MAGPPPANTLFSGDNLEILREYVTDGAVDLVYLDPLFNSNKNYNVLSGTNLGATPRRRSRLSRTPGTGAGTLRPRGQALPGRGHLPPAGRLRAGG